MLWPMTSTCDKMEGRQRGGEGGGGGKGSTEDHS